MNHDDRFRAWFNALPKHIREEAETLGAGLSTLKDPPIGGMREIDEQMLDSDSPHAGASEVYRAITSISQQRERPDAPSEQAGSLTNGQLIRIIHFFLEVLDCHHPQDLASVHALVARIVLGIGDPPPQREIARKFGIPRSTINKRVKEMQERLGLDPSQFMHHTGHCKAFSLGHTLAQIKRQTADHPDKSRSRS